MIIQNEQHLQEVSAILREVASGCGLNTVTFGNQSVFPVYGASGGITVQLVAYMVKGNDKLYEFKPPIYGQQFTIFQSKTGASSYASIPINGLNEWVDEGGVSAAAYRALFEDAAKELAQV